MQLRKTIRKPVGEIEIAPLIDVVFLLIIFFMIVSQMVHAEVEEVTLPEAASGDPVAEAQPGKIIVNVPDSGELVISGRVYSQEAFADLLADEIRLRSVENVSVLIRGDRKAPWEPVGRAMRTCAQRGVARVRVAVREAEAANVE
jgi:biopolymer transport protein ExbD